MSEHYLPRTTPEPKFGPSDPSVLNDPPTGSASATPDFATDPLRAKPIDGLSPCPFCGGKHIGIINGNNRTFVLCCEKSECTAQVWGKTETDAIAKWNERHSPNNP